MKMKYLPESISLSSKKPIPRAKFSITLFLQNHFVYCNNSTKQKQEKISAKPNKKSGREKYFKIFSWLE